MKKIITTLSLLCLLILIVANVGARSFTGPVASNLGPIGAITGFVRRIYMPAVSPEGCAMTFAIASGPSHGTLSQLNSATGLVLYTSSSGFAGSDSFTFTASAFTTGSCTTGSVTSSAATVSLSVQNTRTTINGTLTNPDGSAMVGQAVWALVQTATTFDGFFIVGGSSVRRTLDGGGNYTVSLYSTIGLSPNTFYVLWIVNGASQQGPFYYNIPASTSPIDQATLATNQIYNLNGAQIQLATSDEVEALAAQVNAITLSHTLLGTLHSDTLTGSPTRGAIIVGNSTPKWAAVPRGGAGTYVRSDGTDTGFSALLDGDLPSTMSSKTLNTTVLNSPTISNGTISGIVNSTASIIGGTYTSPTISGGTLSGTFSGTPVINCSACTGIGGSGGLINTGSTTIGADSGGSGTGVIDLQTHNGFSRATIQNNGDFTLKAPWILTAQTAPTLSASGFAKFYYDSTAHQVMLSTEGGAFAAITASTAATALRYDVQRDYGASGSDQQTTGSITGSTTTLTLANAKDFINGDGIMIAGAGTSGHNCINTVSSGGGTTTITLASTCPTTVSGAAVKHDDSAAINAALTAVVNAGGGNILFKAKDRNGVAGKYHVAGALQSNCNSILCMPQITRTQNPVSVGLIGEYGPPITGSSVVPTNGVVIDASDFNDSTPSNFGAIISAKTYATTFTLTDTTFNWVSVNLQNLLIRNKTNPNLTAVQMNNSESLLMKNVFIDAGEAETFTTGSGFTLLTQPTNSNAAGVIMPGLNNIGQQDIQNVAVIGHYVGAVFGENSKVSQMYLIQNYTGARLHGNPALDTWHGGGIYEAQTPIEVTTEIYTQSVIDFNIQIEAYTGTGNWWDTPSGHRVYDPSNALGGKLVAQSDASAAVPGITGGQLLNYEGIDPNDGYYSISGSGSRLTITQTASADPTIAGQFTAANNLGDRAYFAAFGSTYSVSALQRNAIFGADRKMYLATGTGFDVTMQSGGVDKFNFSSSNVFSMLTDNGGAVPNYSISRNANLMTLEGGSAGIAIYNSAGNNINYVLDNSGNYTTLNTGGFSFVSGGTPFGGTTDTRLARAGAGIAEIDNGSAGTYRDLKMRQLYVDATNASSTGAQTINKAAGSVQFAASATSLVVTDSLVTANSLVLCTIQTHDSTMTSVQCVPTSGSFTMFANAAATGTTVVAFHVINQ